jgi:hypothetical protein
VEENNNTNLIEKVTPSHTLDWYVKWTATAFIIAGVICRSAGPEYALYDLIFGVIGTALWGWVSMIWQDRALIVLNTTMFIILVVGLLKAIA